MKVSPVNMTKNTPKFGEIDNYDREVLSELEKKRQIWYSNMESLKTKLFSDEERMSFARKLAMDTLDKSVEGRELNIFEKIAYWIKKIRINRIKI